MEYDVSQDSNVDWSHADTGLILVVANSKESFTRPLVTSDEGTEVVVTPKSDAEDNTIYKVTIDFSGTVEGLTEHYPYTVSVIGDNNGETKVYASQDIKTTGSVTEIRGLDGHCSCTIDGNYNFTLKYTDDGDYYKAFSYRLLASDGSVAAEGVTTSPKSKQHIHHVDELEGRRFTLEITIDSQKPAELQTDHFSESLGGGLDISIDKGTIVLTQEIEL